MTESKFTAALRLELREHIYVLKLNVAYARGVPDCYYSGSRSDLWNEHKYFKTLPPVIELTKPTITSMLQQTWLIGRHHEGRNVAMVIGSTEGHLLLRGLEWQKPIARDDFRERAVTKKELASEIIDLLGPIDGAILP